MTKEDFLCQYVLSRTSHKIDIKLLLDDAEYAYQRICGIGSAIERERHSIID